MTGFDAVEYLSFRLYPSKAVNKARAEVSDGRIRDAAEDYVRGADIFEKALQALSPESLKALVDDEQELEAVQVQTRAQGQENTRFFHRQGAAADFRQWASRLNWSLDEAVALILGKDPNVVTWDRIEPMVPFSAFAERFADIREHLGKAERSGQLVDPVRPDQFYRWAKTRGVTIPAKLEALLDANASKRKSSGRYERSGHEMPSGKEHVPCGNDRDASPGAAPAETTTETARLKHSWKPVGVFSDLNEKVIHLGREESRLKAIRHRASVEREIVAPVAPVATDSTDDLAQMLRKMVLAMAIGRYGYKPQKGRQSTVTDIRNDLQAVGIDLPPSAVKAMLEQASACLPGAADGRRKTGSGG